MRCLSFLRFATVLPAVRLIFRRQGQTLGSRPTPHQFPLSPAKQLGPLKMPLNKVSPGLRTIPSIPSPNLPAFGSLSPLAKTSDSNSGDYAEFNDTFNPFRKQVSLLT